MVVSEILKHPFIIMNRRLSSAQVENAEARLREVQEQREAEINRYSNENVESDDAVESPSPIYDSFFAQNGFATIHLLTNFSSVEFNQIYDFIKEFVSANWNVGRGKKCEFGGKDMLFMVLVTMKNGGTWEFLGNMFLIKTESFQRMIIKFLNMITDYIFKKWVDKLLKEQTMKNIIYTNNTFKNYKFCKYAVDVTFQQCNKPLGNVTEANVYKSGKHKWYG